MNIKMQKSTKSHLVIALAVMAGIMFTLFLFTLSQQTPKKEAFVAGTHRVNFIKSNYQGCGFGLGSFTTNIISDNSISPSNSPSPSCPS